MIGGFKTAAAGAAGNLAYTSRADARSEAEWQSQYQNPARRIAFYSTVALVFIKFGFLQEILQTTVGSSLYLFYIFTPPAILGVVLSGRLKNAISATPVMMWIAFLVWLMLGLPFSSWPGGSAMDLFYYVRDHFLMLFLVAGTVMTWRECRLILYAIAADAVIDLAFVQTARAQNISDRFQLGFSGTVANANDLAAHMLLLLCVVLFSVMRPRGPVLVRLFSCGVVLAAIYLVFQTGSRGALVAIVAGGILFFLRGNGKQRTATLMLAPLLVVLLLAVPRQTLVRILSFSKEEGSTEAAQSRNIREELLRQSIRFTIQRPVFGVGLGQFSIAAGSRTRQTSGVGFYYETHNAYTQVSSECGIPALVFYLAAMYMTVRIFLKVLKQARAAGHGDIETAALSLFLALTTFGTAIIFLSLAYRFYLPALTGIAVALQSAAEREFRLLPAPRTAARF